MTELLPPLFKVCIVVFVAGSLLDMGLRLDAGSALRGLCDVRFVVLTLVWGFVLAPALAWAIAHLMPLEEHYALGLVLIGMAPAAPFVPVLAARGKGDLGSTAALMLLAAAGTVVFMPLALPVVAKGLTVTAWTIARPLLIVVLLPIAAGMAILRGSPGFAGKLLPIVRKVTGVAAVAVIALCVLIYGKGLLDLGGSLAIVAQLIFFAIVMTLTYAVAFGMPHEQKIVLSIGMTTRNIGAAIAPLLAAPDMDQRTVLMVVLGLPNMVLFALLAAKLFGRNAASVAGAGVRA